MKKLYDLVSTFCILMTASVMAYFLLHWDSHTLTLSYDIFFKYAVLIIIAMLIYKGVERLPFRNPALIYFFASVLIALETVFFECILWGWMHPTAKNTALLAIWTFVAIGIITLITMKKNMEDARLINQRIEKWKCNTCIKESK